MAVEERHPQAVHLGLADVRSPDAGQSASEAPLELDDLLRSRHAVERQHRHPMGDGLERRCCRPGDPLRRAVRRDERGEAGFQRAQLPDERVILGIRDLRARALVVEPVVMPNEPAQLRDATGGRSARHPPAVRRVHASSLRTGHVFTTSDLSIQARRATATPRAMHAS